MKELLLQNLKKEDIDFFLLLKSLSVKKGMTENVEQKYNKIMEKKRNDEEVDEGEVEYEEEDIEIILSKI